MEGFQFNFFNSSMTNNTHTDKVVCQRSAEEGVPAEEVNPQAAEQVQGHHVPDQRPNCTSSAS